MSTSIPNYIITTLSEMVHSVAERDEVQHQITLMKLQQQIQTRQVTKQIALCNELIYNARYTRIQKITQIYDYIYTYREVISTYKPFVKTILKQIDHINKQIDAIRNPTEPEKLALRKLAVAFANVKNALTQD